MENSCSDFEFFDLSNATDEEIKEIRDILSNPSSNGSVELPWDVPPLPCVENTFQKAERGASEVLDVTPAIAATTANSLGSVVGQTLLYAPHQVAPALSGQAAQLSLQSTDVIHPVETFIPQIPPISAASAIGAHYATPYLVPRTLPYLRAYPHHVGVPLFTCTLPNSGELTHVPSPYTPFLPLAAPVSTMPQAHLEKPVEHKEEQDIIRAKAKGAGERQFNRRSKKKHVSSGSYYSPPDFVQGADTYSEPVLADDSTLTAGNIGSNRLAAMPCVPVPVPQSTFPVTSGALPMPSYPPGLHPLSYSQISGPQAPTPPVYYVPVFNHTPYSRYIAPASAPMILPVGNVTMPTAGVHPASESDCSVANEASEDVKSSESLAASTESIEKSDSSVPIESDCEASPAPSKSDEKIEKVDTEEIVELPNKVTNDEVADNSSQESTDTLTELSGHRNLSVPNSNPECGDKKHRSFNDSSRRWADLFKKQCTEMNGLDRQHVEEAEKSNLEEPNINKELPNRKLYNVPNSDSVL